MKKNEKGITLVTLILTVILMAILGSAGIYSGKETLKQFHLNSFAREMEMIQANVNIVSKEINNNNPNYIDAEGNILVGIDVTQIALEDLNTRIDNMFTEVERTKSSQYRYMDKIELRKINIENIDKEYIVNFETREVISLDGLTVDGKTYYFISEVIYSYNVQYTPPEWDAPEFNVTTKYENEFCKIKVSDYDTNKFGNIQYKLLQDTEWILASDTSFKVYEPGIYQVKVSDKQGIYTIKKAYVYVFSKLELFLDGIYNTSDGNDNTSTNWTDLSSNENIAIGYNANDKYITGEKGYEFLNNETYFKTSKNIGIFGDTLFTIEAVEKPYSSAPYTKNTVLWWGSNNTSTEDYPKTFWMGTGQATETLEGGYLNNDIVSSSAYQNQINNKTFYYAIRKVERGEITTGNTSMYKMNLNNNSVNNSYTGTTSITTNLSDSQVEIGRGIPYNSENRSFYGVIKAIRIYSKALTDEEINLNYTIDKERYEF